MVKDEEEFIWSKVDGIGKEKKGIVRKEKQYCYDKVNQSVSKLTNPFSL